MQLSLSRFKIPEHYLLRGVMLLLIILFVYQAVWFASIFTGSSYSNIAAAQQKVATLNPLPDIGAWHFFGAYEQFNLDSLPDTTLYLSLQGVLYSTIPANSLALIISGSLPAKAYKIGDEVVSGAIIKQIFPNDVVLEQGGQLQRLRLKKPPLEFAPPPQDVISQ